LRQKYLQDEQELRSLFNQRTVLVGQIENGIMQLQDPATKASVLAILEPQTNALLDKQKMMNDRIGALLVALNRMVVSLQSGELQWYISEDGKVRQLYVFNRARFEQIKIDLHRTRRLGRSVGSKSDQLSGADILRLVQQQRQELAGSQASGFNGPLVGQRWIAQSNASSFPNALYLIA